MQELTDFMGEAWRTYMFSLLNYYIRGCEWIY